MEYVEQAPAAGEARWRRIVNYPLVAMLIAIVLYAAATALAIAISSVIPPLHSKTLTMIVKDGIILGLTIVTYKLAIARLGQHPRDDLPARKALPGLGMGLLLGFVIFSVVVGAAALADVYNIVGKGSTDQLVHDLVATSLMPGFMEEILFRGILFRWIEEWAGSWVALLLTSAFFGFAHIMNPNATVVAALGIAIEAGVLLGAAYMLTRNLWLAIGLHAAWNFTQGFIFDIPVSGTAEEGLVTAKLSGPALLSGGGFGLEASLFAMVIATAAGVFLLIVAIRRGELVQPRWVRRRRLTAAAA
jgi:hypothetical protein